MAERLLYDFLATMEAGANSDPEPMLLPKNTASWLINSTVRGGFVRPRPPLMRRTLVFPSDEVQAAVEKGFFQGAGYYRSDFSVSQLVAQIAGRLFTFTESGESWNVAEITIPGDPNDATTNQVWMNQAEKWLIITDGSAKLPIFYDGVTARRSLGESRLLGTAVAFNPVAPPALGGTVAVTLAEDYTGPYNVMVLFNGEYYQPIQTAGAVASYQVLLTTAPGGQFPTAETGSVDFFDTAYEDALVPDDYATKWTAQIGLAGNPILAAGSVIQINPAPLYPGNFVNWQVEFVFLRDGINRTYRVTHPRYDNNAPQIRFGNPALYTALKPAPSGNVIATGSQIVVQPGYVGTLTSAVLVTRPSLRWTLGFATPHNLAVGQKIIIRGKEASLPEKDYTVTVGVVLTPLTLQVLIAAVTYLPVLNSVAQRATTGPSVVVGVTLDPFATPNVGSTATVTIDSLYSGPDNQSVWIGTVQFLISKLLPTAPTTTLTLVNLTDASLVNYTNPSEILSVAELPAGRMGAYGIGHQAMCLIDGTSYIYGDAVGGPSGTPAFNYRDSVLRTTENTFLLGGGAFRIPNSGEIITSMMFASILDRAYGQGPLIIGTPTSIFTCDVPTDRSKWIALTNPILTQALIGKGPLAQNSTVLANSDTIFRSVEGVASLIFGRRNFETWGNTPISTEVNRTVERDIVSLLSYGSAVVFDNRLLMTAAPQVSDQGVYHVASLVLNFDPVSSLRGKAPSIWEGIWTGTNALQYVVGLFNGVERCFQFTFNQRDNKIELYEQLKSNAAGQYFDNGDIRIAQVIESPCIFLPKERPQDMPLVRLMNGRIHLDDIVGTVHVKVLYKPDFYPCWIDWHEFDVCATVDPNNDDSQPGYRTPIGLGEPGTVQCEEANNRPMRVGRFFQLRFEIAGQCRFMGGEFAAVPEPNITFPPPLCCEINQDLT